VRLGAFSSVCINWLPPIIQNFKQDYPQIDINVEQADFSSIASAVKTGRLDLGFSALPVTEKLTVLPLVKDEIYCITPNDFIPANRTTVTAADLVDQNFILQRGDYDKDTKAALDHYQIRPTPCASPSTTNRSSDGRGRHGHGHPAGTGARTR
jgi:Transcriptional regulator